MLKNKLLDIRLGRRFKRAKDFAIILDISSPYYSELENNKKQPSLEGAFKIAAKLNLKIDDIWFEEGE